jgi:UDP-glucuronate 4-epimerase
MKSVLVTGGAGFIGSHVGQALLKKGIRLAVIDNFNAYYSPEIKRKNVELLYNDSRQSGSFSLHEGDIRDKEFVEKVFGEFKPDVTIHLAASAGVRPSIVDPDLYVKQNIVGTINILEAMRSSCSDKLVFASSSSVYGNNKKIPFSESDNVDRPISPYAATKKSCELLCHTYHHLFDMNIACLRFFTVYGPRQRPDLAIYKFTQNIIEGKPIKMFGDGSTMRDYTYIDDIVDGVLKATEWIDSEEKRYDIFNLGESNTVTLKQMIEVIEAAVGKKAVIIKDAMQQGDVERTYADISHSKEVLGYNPSTEFAQGIKRFVEWYKSDRM